MISTARVCFFTLRDSFVKDGVCLHDLSNARLILMLSDQFSSFSFITYQDKNRNQYYNTEIKLGKLYVLPFINTFLNGVVNFHAVWKVLKQAQKENDVLIIQFPFKSFFLPFLLKKPVVAHVCSNLLSASKNPVKYKGVHRLIAICYANLFHLFNKISFNKKNFRVITNGSELAKLYGSFNAVPVVSSSIYRKEIVNIEDVKRRNGTFKILFVGRPSLEKGFDTLLDSFHQLSITEKVELTCVGFTQAEYEKLYGVNTNAGDKKITFLGTVPFGDKLFLIYRSADVLVLPSRSEGTPRVLIEARSFGCPVIATRVGGIPDSIEDGIDGLLFEAGNATQLTSHLKDLVVNENKRYGLAINGVKRAKTMTVEDFSNTFVRIINEF